MVRFVTAGSSCCHRPDEHDERRDCGDITAARPTSPAPPSAPSLIVRSLIFPKRRHTCRNSSYAVVSKSIPMSPNVLNCLNIDFQTSPW
jgi:hypothetical protein